MNDYLPLPGSVPARVVAYLHALPGGGDVSTAVIAEALEQDSSTILNCMGAAVAADLVVREKRDLRYYWRRGSQRVPDGFIAANQPKARAAQSPVFDPPPKPSAGVNIDAIHRADAARATERQRVDSASRSTARDGVSLLDVPRFVGVVSQPEAAKEPPSKRLAALKPMHAPSSSLPFPDPDAAFETPPPSQPNPAPRAEPVVAPALPPAAPITAESGAACAAPAPVCQDGTSAALTLPAPMRCAVWSDGTLAIEKDGQTQTYTPDETRAIVRYLERVLVGEGAE